MGFSGTFSGRSHGASSRGGIRVRKVEPLEPRLCLSHPSVVPTNFLYGLPGDIPLVGDWDGDGEETPGVYRDGFFHLRNSKTEGPADLSFRYGLVGDTPIAGDWDGDGVDTIGIVRGNAWHLRNSNHTGIGEVMFTYGLVGDIPIIGDWDGDGVDTAGIVRPRAVTENFDGEGGKLINTQWHLRNTNDTGIADIAFTYAATNGAPTHCLLTDPQTCFQTIDFQFAPPLGNGGNGIPVVGDWDGDGIDTRGVFFDGEWRVRNSLSAGEVDEAFSFGMEGVVPIVAIGSGPFTSELRTIEGFVDGNRWVFNDGDDAVHGCPPDPDLPCIT